MSGQEGHEHKNEHRVTQVRALASGEEQIIASLHFILPFSDLSEETGLPGQVLKEYLTRLILDGLVICMEWNQQKKDFVPADQNNCDLEDGAFMATKEGLRAYYYSA
ncbi:MAG: hypothetical protein HGB11_13955 [Chlorobiales bacterium]|nr:hypothetical protein [Chlorobiales bacterium]